MSLIKQELDHWLDGVDYTVLNSPSYMPSTFSLEFMNWIKLVNGDTPEDNKTPPVHLAMLDKVSAGVADYIANLCFRGAAKTTLFMEYLTLYVAQFGSLPNFGDITGMIYVSDSMDNGVKSARQNIEHRYQNSSYLKYWIPEAIFTDKMLLFKNRDGHRLGVKMFGAKTGLRGTKIFGKRPVLCVLDDLVSDEDAKSKASMDAIKDTVYKGVNHALDPTRRKVIFNGTPFNKEDILIEAVESGTWDVNVWPVCERFPCSREEFVGAWEDRFSFDYIKKQYDMAVANHKESAFFQELMLRITSEEERLVHNGEIRWYKRSELLARQHGYNFYITTDFATSSKQTADYSVIFVWALNANGDWFWVDGIMKRQTLSITLDDLFKFVQKYKPESVGIEVTGQQQGFISIIEERMQRQMTFFNLAMTKGEKGIRSTGDKLSRFQLILPMFTQGKMYYPEELKDSTVLSILMGQYRLITSSGIKGKDDGVDATSQLALLKTYRPSEDVPVHEDEVSRWEAEEPDTNTHAMSSYVV